MENESKFNITINIKDKIGIFKDTVAIFAENNVDIVSVFQDITNKNYIPLEFITHKTSEINIRKALIKIEKLENVYGIDNIIKM